MRNLWKSVLGLWAIGMWLGVSASAQAAGAIGPYYATPSWDQTLPAATRFIVLSNMNNQAVLDRETGLVWEQSPGTTPQNWDTAQDICNDKSVGGRKGWRLPSVQELASLIDPTMSFLALPAGHPFSNVQSVIPFGLSGYWSASTYAASPNFKWTVNMANGVVARLTDRLDTLYFWCVRGGQGTDLQ